jgi:hypothetical protein
VKSADGSTLRLVWRNLPTRDAAPSPGSQPIPSAPIRWLTGLIWLASAAVGVAAGRSGSENARRMPGWFRACLRTRVGTWANPLAAAPRSLVGHAVAAGCLLAAGWELIGLETLLGSRARELALATRSYHERAVYQKGLTLGVLAAWGCMVAWVYGRPRRSGFWRMTLGLGTFGLLALAGVVSLHAVDRVANEAWLQVPVIQWLKLGVTVWAVWPSLISGNRDGG